jgi:periplasmic protein TonB
MLMPVSVAVHAAALATVLLVPVLRPAEIPPPAPSSVPWRVPPHVAPPAPRRETRPPAMRAGGARALTRVDPMAPSSAPPRPPIEELPLGPPDDSPPPVCLKDCGVGPGTGQTSAVGSEAGPGDSGSGPPTVRAGGVIQPPARVVYVPPVYPSIAQAAGIGGVVILDCTIAPDGRVVDVRVLSGHPLLNEAAVSAVRQWTYRATRLDGVPVAVLMTVTVRFIAHR